jgi:fluoride ion exporter CrcB/FEX
MSSLPLVPVVLSLLLLGAHFLRAGSALMLAVILLFVVVFFVRRPWAARLVQMALLLGTLEWVRTLVRLMSDRQQAGEPVLRLVLILGAVATLTACSTLAFETRRLRQRYGLRPPVA